MYSYYKAVAQGIIVDVFDSREMVYVKHNYTGIVIRCREEEHPFGVLSSDGSTIWAIEPTEGYELVELVPFADGAEYDRLKTEIDAQRTPEYTETETPAGDEHVMTVAELRAKVAMMEAMINRLLEKETAK